MFGWGLDCLESLTAERLTSKLFKLPLGGYSLEMHLPLPFPAPAAVTSPLRPRPLGHWHCSQTLGLWGMVLFPFPITVLHVRLCLSPGVPDSRLRLQRTLTDPRGCKRGARGAVRDPLSWRPCLPAPPRSFCCPLPLSHGRLAATELVQIPPLPTNCPGDRHHRPGPAAVGGQTWSQAFLFSHVCVCGGAGQHSGGEGGYCIS